MGVISVKWVPVRTAGKLLRVSKQRIHQLLRSGKLSGQVLDGVHLVSMQSIAARYNNQEVRIGRRKGAR